VRHRPRTTGQPRPVVLAGAQRAARNCVVIDLMTAHARPRGLRQGLAALDVAWSLHGGPPYADGLTLTSRRGERGTGPATNDGTSAPAPSLRGLVSTAWS
jgi:hypothetical protein